MAILAVLSSVAMISWVGYQRTQVLTAARRDLVGLLREAQGNAIANTDQRHWGVHIDNPAGGLDAFAEIFSTPDAMYAGGTVVQTRTFRGVDFSEPAESSSLDIIFTQRTGRVLGSGAARVSYLDGLTGNRTFKVAEYVGTGGTCDVASNTSWNCEDIYQQGNSGYFSSIASDSRGSAWASFQRSSGDRLMAAQFVGSQGNCVLFNGSAAWDCFTVQQTGNVGEYTSTAVDSNSNPWISYFDVTNGALRVATRGGGFGSSCPGGAAGWTCDVIDSSANTGTHTSIAFDVSGNPWVSYYETSGPLQYLKVASYVGGGSGSGCTGGSADWNCTIIDRVGNTGRYSSLTFDVSGSAWVSYFESSSNNLKVANYVGNGTQTTCGAGGSTDWNCTIVDATGTLGLYTSITVDFSNNPWVSYYGIGEGLNVANYVGDGAQVSCAGGSQDWNCVTVDPTATMSGNEQTSIAVASSGNPWVSYYDSTTTSLRVANYVGDGAQVSCAGGSQDWNCVTVDNSASDTGQQSALTISSFIVTRLFRIAEPGETGEIRVGTEGGILVE